jgi:hypothetical protein
MIITIINLTPLALIEINTQKCRFDLPYPGGTKEGISPLYHKKIKEKR